MKQAKQTKQTKAANAETSAPQRKQPKGSRGDDATRTANLVAKTSVTVNAPAARVWTALTDPAANAKFMFGATVASDWTEGSPITWTGEWQGRPYADKGVIRRAERNRVLEYTHFSPLAGLPDTPENYHTVHIELSSKGSQTVVSLTQDNNATEEARADSEKNWRMMLDGLKKVVEGR